MPDTPESPPEAVTLLGFARQQSLGEQQEMPFAIVSGQAVTQVPTDLYIPPQALEVFLDAFEGPLDLLLYLIRKQNLDILSINVFEITKQYMEYVRLMQALNLELAADYLVMASILAEIKSRILLPKPDPESEEELDPRAELIRRLQEYEQFKEAAENIDQLPRQGREFFVRESARKEHKTVLQFPDVELKEMLLAFSQVMLRTERFEKHQIARETLSTRERMSQVLEQLNGQNFVPFISLFRQEEGKLGVVVTFLAIMELCKEGLVDLIQNDTYAPIHLKARSE